MDNSATMHGRAKEALAFTWRPYGYLGSSKLFPRLLLLLSHRLSSWTALILSLLFLHGMETRENLQGMRRIVASQRYDTRSYGTYRRALRAAHMGRRGSSFQTFWGLNGICGFSVSTLFFFDVVYTLHGMMHVVMMRGDHIVRGQSQWLEIVHISQPFTATDIYHRHQTSIDG